MLNVACLNLISRTSDDDQPNGWAGFAINLKLRKVKEKLKSWFTDYEKERKRKEKDLVSELEFFDLKAENEALPPLEEDIRLVIRSDWLILYSLEERDLLQKCKLNWLKLGDKNTTFFHRFLSFPPKNREI